MVRRARMSPDGKVALVTGSGRGIGRAIACELARRGFILVINGRKDEEALDDTVREIESLGGRAIAILADMTVPQEVDLTISRVTEELGTIHVLVNNVGDFLLKPLLDVTPDEWTETVASNLHSAFFASRAAVLGMIENGWGRIINIGLAGSDIPGASPRITPYAVAKTGLWILTKCLAREVAGKGVTVNMVAPGVIDDPNRQQRYGSAVTVPAGRFGRPEEVAGAIMFFVDDRSSYITGTCVNVSGGWESVR